MTKTLNDFTMETSGGLSLDIPRLMQLPPEEFLEVLEANSRQYMEHHSTPIKCQECKTNIATPNKLVRYYGSNLHTECFSEVYAREKNKINKREREYWDRLANLIHNAPTRT